MMAGMCHRVDARHLLRAVPGLDQGDLRDLQDEWARWTASSRTGFISWQDSWNQWVDSGGGYVTFRPPRCRDCRGGFSQRDLARTGSPVCRSCHGTRRGQQQRLRADRIPVG